MAPRPTMSGEASLARHKAMTESIGSSGGSHASKPKIANQLHVANIHVDLDEEGLREMFGEYGKVTHIDRKHKNAHLPLARPNPRGEHGHPTGDAAQYSRIHAFVHMSTNEEAEAALKALNGRQYMAPDWCLQVSLARKQEKRAREEQEEEPAENPQKRLREIEEEQEEEEEGHEEEAEKEAEPEKEQEKEQREEQEEEQEEQQAGEEGEEVTVNNVDALCDRVRDRDDINTPKKIKPTNDPAVLPGLLKLWNAGDEMREKAKLWKGRADAAEYTGKAWSEQDEKRYKDLQNAVMSVFLANLQANETMEMDWEARLKQTPAQTQTRKAILEQMAFLGKMDELVRLPQTMAMWRMAKDDIRQALAAWKARHKKRGEAEMYHI